MAKCYLCGKESNVEIKISAYDKQNCSVQTKYVCGICALDRDFIKDEGLAELIREEEGIPKGKACEYCKYMWQSQDKYFCKYHNNFELDKEEVSKNFCDNFERYRP